MILFLLILSVAVNVALAFAVFTRGLVIDAQSTDIELLETENQQLRMRAADLEKILTYRNHQAR